jgi:imidazoleglycerol-phosphate dehydratase
MKTPSMVRKKSPVTRARSARGNRRASVGRATSETSIRVDLALDGSGKYSVATGIPFFDHMLETLSRHSLIDMKIKADGDLAIDDHHTVEDVGIAIGQAIDQALGDKRGIVRFGHAEVPLDEALVAVTVDLSGRPFLVYNLRLRQHRVGNFEVELVNDFMQALMNAAGMNLHVNVRYGRNAHHVIEAAFKALARALSQACARNPRIRDVPSTKGSLKG